LLDHRGDFELLVTKKIGADKATNIDWSSPRLLCIAGDFSKYDLHAVGQMQRNIELTLTSKADVEKARHLIEQSYEAN
jgi:hypothetical protein